MVKEDFIVGKWYKNIGIADNYIAPFISFEGFEKDYWIIDQKRNFIKNNKYESNTDTKYLTSHWKDAIECSIDEIKHILPKNHPDLINITPKIYELW